jgi:hypothetical protein
MFQNAALALTCGVIVGLVVVGLIHARAVKSLDLEKGKEIRDFNKTNPHLVLPPKIKTTKPEIQKILISPKANRMGASSKDLSFGAKSPLSACRSAADLSFGAKSPLGACRSAADLSFEAKSPKGLSGAKSSGSLEESSREL